MPCDTACSAMQYVPFRIQKRHTWENVVAFLPIYPAAKMFHVSVSMFHEMLTPETFGRSPKLQLASFRHSLERRAARCRKGPHRHSHADLRNPPGTVSFRACLPSLWLLAWQAGSLAVCFLVAIPWRCCLAFSLCMMSGRAGVARQPIKSH